MFAQQTYHSASHYIANTEAISDDHPINLPSSDIFLPYHARKSISTHVIANDQYTDGRLPRLKPCHFGQDNIIDRGESICG